MGGTGRGGWVHPKGAFSMAVSGLGFRKVLAGIVWPIHLLICMIGLRKQSSQASVSSIEVFLQSG